MRKQTKVVLAAALLTLGASFSAFAAKTGTWVLEDEGWMCYDKEGDEYTDEFCLSYGKEYFVGEDGLMVTNDWVEYEGDYYYVGSDGAKTINDWRFVTPMDDEEADEEWYYFGSKGKMETGKEVIKGKTYYFNSYGVMLTGWVEYDSNTKIAEAADTYSANLTYCDENGARVVADWVKTWAPGTPEDEQDDADLFWHYIKANGALQTNKAKSIEGETYLFNTDGQMLTGWVKATCSNAEGNFDRFSKFEGNVATGIDVANDEGLFYCGTADQGQVKKNRWVKTWMPAQWADADDDNSQYWYYLGKTGEAFIPTTASQANAETFVDGATRLFDDGDEFGAQLKTINNKTYAFKNDARMWSGLAEIEGVRYYFGGADDGEMATGAVMIADEDGAEYKFYFGKNDKNGYVKGAAVTGSAERYLYDNGLLVTCDDKYDEVPVGEYSYIINANGSIQTSAKEYKEDGVVLVDADEYEFYTLTSDGAKKGAIK